MGILILPVPKGWEEPNPEGESGYLGQMIGIAGVSRPPQSLRDYAGCTTSSTVLTKITKKLFEDLAMKKKKQTKVRVMFPGFMDLTKRKSENSLSIEVRRGDELLGSLLMGRGSVEWWPKGNKVNSVKKGWRAFVKILEEQMR